MECEWIVDRARLRHLKEQHPEWKQEKLAEILGRSQSWISKWLKRFAEAEPDDHTVFLSQSREPHTRQKHVQPEVERKILEIRDHPPENLARVPGPVTILYYLHRDEGLKEANAYLPRSTSTIWEILDRNQRIYRESRPKPQPEDRPEPLEHIQIDFKSISSVPADPDGKKQHVVETLNIVDKGTSILLTATPREDFNAETVITAMVDSFLVNGLPEVITFDRDPRFIGSWSAKDFPAPFMRFLMCLGIRVHVCPPKRPDKNAFGERYHRNYASECLAIHQPNSLEKTMECTAAYYQHYNWERPNQALTCGNLPPRVAFPDLPKRPGLPTWVDPDSWLKQINGRYYRRRVNSSGTVQIGGLRYYISRQLKRQMVVLRVDANLQQLTVLLDDNLFKQMPIKGLYATPRMVLEDYIPLIQAEAVSDYRRYLLKRRSYH
jgi:transposase InsO family protein